MVYRLLGWGVVGGAYHKIQIVSCATAKLYIMELVHRLRNSLRFSEKWVKYWDLYNPLDALLNPPLVN